MIDDQQAIEAAFPGAQDHGEGLVTFALYAPDKRCVHLMGEMNGWQSPGIEMKDRGWGFWICSQHLERGKCAYQFVIDEEIVVCDPYAQEIRWMDDPQAPPHAVIDVGRPIYRWQNDHWQRPSFRDLVIYELHVGDFSPEGTFHGVQTRLDHLGELGVNAVQFMPLCETAPGNWWGYEPTYYLAVRGRYGPFESLLRLVDEIHGRGMACILDIVLAHTAREHPFNRMYEYHQSPWYGESLGHQGMGLPMLDFSKDATNTFVRDVQAYWLRVLHFDGFRYDYLAAIGSDEHGRGLPYLMQTAREIRPPAYLIGEQIPEAPEEVNISEIGGVWHTRCRLALATLLTGTDHEPYRWDDFADAVTAFDPSTQEYDRAERMINYVESHDDPRLVTQILQTGADHDRALARAKLAMSILATIPGQMQIYSGQEWGQEAPLVQEENHIDWRMLDQPEGRDLHEHCRQMIRLRRSHAAIRDENFRWLLVDDAQRCIAFYRWLGESDQVVVVANFSDEPRTLHIPFPHAGQWHLYPSREIHRVEEQQEWTVEADSAVVFLVGVS